ncbi:serine--tRNA ligase [Mycoplasma sp. 1654_15]|uniref:serine--tRNA ligase n=1 Tax=Mycoplasma sp. 1654_15 TaxID=2725994 RepID=UPI001449FF00|nr:serine--tRNA ligase [Mycoplasma sp. 1654_15]QJB71446.1 serine--tRNA ligase [Mycoplasma sp. 1654_15]
MITLKFILANVELVKTKLAQRNFDIKVIDEIVAFGTQKNELLVELNELKARRNEISDQIGKLAREKKETRSLKEEVIKINEDISGIETDFNEIDFKVENMLLRIPNLPLDDVPVGKDENDNVILETWAEVEQKSFKILPHYEIATELDIIDFKRAVKLSGTRFVIYKNEGARLVRALMNFMLDTHISNGYKEILPNTLILEEALYGTAQLPKFAEDLYKVNDSNLWLISTAEIPITNFYSQEIINLDKPIKFVGYSKSYRSEAGSGGRDTKGIIRMHEFHKVELVKITSQKEALSEFEKTVDDAANILKLLKIPHRRVVLSTGDMGFASKKTIDLEAWMPSEQRYREVSSISICGDFQAQRMKLRYKEDGKTLYANTINGSGLAIDRIIAIILEQYQTEEGFIEIPEVLIPYFGKIQKISKENK